MILRLLLFSISVSLAACGIPGKISRLLFGEPNTRSPAPLEEIEGTVEVERLWIKKIGKGAGERYLKLNPVTIGQVVFAADWKGRVTAVDVESGQAIWKQDLGRPVSGGPGAGEGKVYVGTSDGEVLALSQEDGRVVWKTPVSSEVLSAPRAANGVAIARTVDGKLFGLNANSGRRRWVYERAEPVLTLRGTSAPTLIDGLVVAGFDSGRLVALDISTGRLTWEARIAMPSGRSDLERMVDIDSQPLVSVGTIYVATLQGRVAAVSLDRGQTLWSRDISSQAGIGMDDRNVYLTDEESKILALDQLTGNPVWKQEKLVARSLTAPISIGPYLVVGDFEGYLHWMRRGDGQLVARAKLDDSRILAPPLGTADMVLAYSTDGRLAAFRLR